MSKVANAKVKAWRRAAGKAKGKDAALEPMLGATWGDETFEIPYGELDASASAHSSQWEPLWVSKEPTTSKEPKEPECMEHDPSRTGVATGPSCVERSLPRHMTAPKLGLNETVELLSLVLSAGDQDPDLTAPSAVLKAKLALFYLKKPPPPTMSPGVERLTREVKSRRGIRSPPMDTCSSPFHPPVGTVPVGSLDDTTEAKIKSYGLAALAP